jgi:hypothetical protein
VRRSAQLGTLLALTAPGVALLAPAAVAAPSLGVTTAKPGVLQAAWFWQNAYQQANPPIGEAPPPVTEPSGVPKGDLAVANTSNDGSSSKVTALAFELGKAAKAGSSITTVTFSLTLDKSPEAGNLNAAAAPVVACLVTRGWAPAEGGDYSDRPAVDCDTKVKPTIKGDTFTFEVPAIAQEWVGAANLGVALVNDPDNAQPFQAVFTGPKTVKATMVFSPPLPAVTTDDGTTTTTSGTGSTGGPTGGSSTTTGGSVAPPSAPVDLPPAAPATDAAPDAGQAPQVAGDATAAAVPAARVVAAPSSPNLAFWIGAVALALLIVTASVVLGDPSVPVPTATTSRLGRVLRERELAGKSELSQQDLTPTLTPRRV